MSEQPREWPLGELLRHARGRMSIRAAARRADISESRWRQVEAGVQRVAGAVDVPVNPRPETVVSMARAVGADVETALRLAGHDADQYGWLVQGGMEQLPPEVREWFSRLPRDDRDAVLVELQRLAADAELQQGKLGQSQRRAQ